MTTPDQAARSIREAVERQQLSRERARETAVEIARQREQETETEGGQPE